MKYFLSTAVLFLLLSCIKEGGPSVEPTIAPGNQPHTIDVLRGKSKAQILKMKYDQLKATCTLNAIKTTQDQSNEPSANLKPPVLTLPELPVKNPKENIFTYDLKLQQIIDQDLIKEQYTTLKIDLDGLFLKANLVLKPIVFQDLINLDFNKKKYIMKYTPVLFYNINYEIQRDYSLPFVGYFNGKIYEKIETQNTFITGFEVGWDRYDFNINCKLDRTINSEDSDLKNEFEGQWVVVNRP